MDGTVWLHGFGVRITHNDSSVSVVINTWTDQRLNYLLALQALRTDSDFLAWWGQQGLNSEEVNPLDDEYVTVEYFDSSTQTWKVA